METSSPVPRILQSRRNCSPFGGIPRNWKQDIRWVHENIVTFVPPSGGSLEIGNYAESLQCSDHWLQRVPPSGGSLEIGNRQSVCCRGTPLPVPPSGGSLEIGNVAEALMAGPLSLGEVPPSGGSLEIGNASHCSSLCERWIVPPSGGSLEIGNLLLDALPLKGSFILGSPFGGIPRNWKQLVGSLATLGCIC